MTFTKALLYAQYLLLILMLAGLLGNRWQLLPFKLAFGGFALAVAVSALVSLVALIAFGFSFGRLGADAGNASLATFALGAMPLLATITLVGAGFKVPRIHDISTDTENNLAFINAHKLRQPGENSLEFPAVGVIRQQREHYPHIGPLRIADAPASAYDKSLRVAAMLGWRVAYRDDALGFFEATDKTAIFGFVDDVVVRVSAEEGGSRIDLRSVSRVGVSDLGANAKRIDRFRTAFEALE